MVTPAQSSVQTFRLQAAALLLYQAVLHSEVGQAFLVLLDLLQVRESNRIQVLHAYGQWFHALAATGLSWQDYLLVQVLCADNPLTQQAQTIALAELPIALVEAAKQDLRSLQALYNCPGEQVSQWVQTVTNHLTPAIAWNLDTARSTHPQVVALRQQPIWATVTTATDWAELLPNLVAHYQQTGVGVFAQYHVFRWRSHQLEGVPYPDPIRLTELVGYESQKATLIKNTEALLAGFPALHVLLYGSRGSGKSSLVKALLQACAGQGLRLIELAKAELRELPALVDRVRQVPQKFIIFVDDLSFEEDDDAYKALKVVLEGNVTARPQNVVIYATSNRRHLIREFFGDRPRPRDADEVHAWDTMQEKLSFSDRFGLTLTFEPADQDTYLAIVRHLADQANLVITPEDLQFRALQWATRQNGRSGRTARQFIDFLQAELG